MNQDRAIFLGIDGGGTSTLAWLADESGLVLGRGDDGPSNPKVIGFPAAFRSIDRAIDLAFSAANLPRAGVDSACCGLAGFDRPEDRAELGAWAERVGLADRFHPVNDAALVLSAGTAEGWGVGVISGTGSIAFGRNRQGNSARAGGWGPLLGDEGSGYAVVLAAFRRVARRADGREPFDGPADPLTDHLCRALDVPHPSGLISVLYQPSMDRTRIAALAPVIVGAVDDDPTIVDDLLAPAGRDLGVAALAVARALEVEPGPIPLALSGGFLVSVPIVRDRLVATVAEAGYRPDSAVVTEPVRGALILASEAWAAAVGRASAREFHIEGRNPPSRSDH